MSFRRYGFSEVDYSICALRACRLARQKSLFEPVTETLQDRPSITSLDWSHHVTSVKFSSAPLKIERACQGA